MRYNKIRKMDISDGEGVRVSLFTQGCHFHCKGCFNPETWDFQGGREFTPDILETLLNLCKKDYISGLSILGGEPLCDENFTTVKNIAMTFKSQKQLENKDIWIWTGYEIEDIMNDPKKKMILEYIDYIICGQFIEEKKNLKLQWAGSENQRFINVKETLKQGNIVLAGDMLN